MARKPKIAVIMDENTSTGGERYDVSKHYFSAIGRAGGFAFGIPYAPDMVDDVVEEFDGFVSVGGRINFPVDWYVAGDRSQYPTSDRLAVDMALMKGFLGRDKPVLGICNGMQMLACLHGCRMVSDIRATRPDIIPHDGDELLHTASVVPGTALARILGTDRLDVNTFHREAVVDISDKAIASAHAPDGVVEAIEIPAYRFAIGLQWHPEAMATDHRGHRVFEAFVEAARRA